MCNIDDSLVVLVLLTLDPLSDEIQKGILSFLRVWLRLIILLKLFDVNRDSRIDFIFLLEFFQIIVGTTLRNLKLGKWIRSILGYSEYLGEMAVNLNSRLEILVSNFFSNDTCCHNTANEWRSFDYDPTAFEVFIKVFF